MKSDENNLSYRILVIDDNASIHEDFCKILMNRKTQDRNLDDMESALFGSKPRTMSSPIFEIDCAFQGKEGLDLVRQAKASGRTYALTFVDVRMPPGWDGIETIRRLWLECPDLQVVLCTAYADYSWKQIHDILGETDSLLILKKPFDNMEVLQLCHTLTCKWELYRQVQNQLDNLENRVRQRTEEKERTRAMLMAALTYSPVGIVIFDVENECIRWANPAALRICDPGDLFSMDSRAGNRSGNWQAFRLNGEKYSFEDLPLQQAIVTGEIIQNEEFLLRDAQGREQWLLSSAAPIRDPDGCINAGIIIFQDITERKQAEDDQKNMLAQLHQAQKMESIGILAGGVAHDFNNLLHVMSGNIELLLVDNNFEQCHKSRLTTAVKCIDRASKLVKQLLLYSRKAVVQKQQLDLNIEVTEVTRMLERTIPKMVNIELRLANRLWTVHADRVQVGQVLLNLGSNASDAMPEGGSLVIETSNVFLDAGFTEAGLIPKPGHYVMMSISDTGVGMDQQTLARIYDPFFTTKDVGKGTGLGLASVYGIVTGHDGHILCESEPGQGTTFKIYWPAIQETGATEGVLPSTSEGLFPSIDASPLKGTETLLVVDDEADILNLLTEALGFYGYTVLTANSGEEALSLYAEKGPSIHMVILDLSMPGIGGRQCLKKLLEMNPSLCVLLNSGYSDNDQTTDILQTKAMGFIGKPYQIKDLLVKIREVLEFSFHHRDKRED